jgi:hypothetical protein
MNKEKLLLVDYRDQFYFSTRHRGASVDIEKLRDYFFDRGFSLVKKYFYEVDFRRDDYKDSWVLYQSSEDPNLSYKDYVEDVLLGLKAQGANLIPDFKYFRAHHNKVFMEMLREVNSLPKCNRRLF